MTCVLEKVLDPSRLRAAACAGLALAMGALLAACSNGVSRFDYPASFAGNGGDDNLTTSSLGPVPAQPVYQDGGASNSSAVVRQDLPPPQPGQAAPRNGGQGAQYGQNTRDRRNAQYGQGQAQPYAQAQQQNQDQNQNQQVASANAGYVPSTPLPPRSYTEEQEKYENGTAKRGQSAPEPPADRSHTVERGDTLYKLSERYGVPVADIRSANGMRGSILSIGEKLTIPGAGSGTAVSEPKVATSTYTVKRGDSLARIARAHDVSRQELERMNDLRNPRLLQPGQELKVPAGSSADQAPVQVASRSGDVPALRTKPLNGDTTASAQPKAQQKMAARTESLPQPEPMAGNQFRWPVRGRIMAGFGKSDGGKHNDGINVAVPKGTEIKAAENGVVAYAGSELEPYGNLILIRHANNWVTAYAHNDKLMVKRGDTVRRGQVIAKAGQSGNVSQPQLHFELRKGSKPVDPLSYMANS